MLNIRKKYRKCVICKNIIDAYEPISLFFRKMQEQYGYFPGPPETCNTKEYLCSICHSSDRDRLCIAFMEKLLKKKGKNLKLLHIAPAKPINEAIQMRFPNISVKNMDLLLCIGTCSR